MFDRIRTQLRLLIHGCDMCGRRFVTTEDGYLCDACDDVWCETITGMYKVRLATDNPDEYGRMEL